jgi:hypothetical protein
LLISGLRAAPGAAAWVGKSRMIADRLTLRNACAGPARRAADRPERWVLQGPEARARTRALLKTRVGHACAERAAARLGRR